MSVQLHILAADDQPEITAYLQEYLASLGHRVDTAANGIEALTRISSAHREQDSYQLLLIDARMPLLDGLSLVRELRRGKDPTDVAFICGDPSMMTLLDNEAQHLGCLMVLTKPFDPSQLVQLVEFVVLRASRRLSQAAQPAAAAAGQPAAVVRNLPPALELTAPATASRSPSPSPVAEEYLPTSAAQTARRERANAIANGNTNTNTNTNQVERRSQVFYPTEPVPSTRTPLPGSSPRTPSPVAMPPSLQGGTTSAFRQGGTAPIQPPQRTQDPRYTSRIAQPPLDPRQTQGLSQPPQRAQDPRYTSRVAHPPAPPTQPPAQLGPRLPPSIDPYARRSTTTSRIEAPLAPPTGQTGQIRLPANPAYPSNPANGSTEVRRHPQVLPQTLPPIQPPGQQVRPLPPPPVAAPPPRGSIRPDLLPDKDPEPTIGRMRRSVGNGPGNQAQDGSVARMVTCVHCAGAFRAVIKQIPYNSLCVHCGQINRIDP